MASIKKDQLTAPGSGGAWRKHLRPEFKREFWKAERKAQKQKALQETASD
jgi:hypothetical protein